MTSGGRFDFDDGGTYCGGWEDGKAHGFGVCTGPKSQGEYAGAWSGGFEVSGVYVWTSGNNYRGQWTQGKRHGVGVETKGRWVYQGEWTQGFKGRYGARYSSATGAKYEGTWTTGLQDGYGVETYADGGTYQGQWLRGVRHGYGVRQSVPYGLAAHSRLKGRRESLTSLRSEQDDDQTVKDRDRKIDDSRGGFVLTGRRRDDSDAGGLLVRSPTAEEEASSAAVAAAEKTKRRSGSADKPRSSLRKTIADGLKLRLQRSTGDIQDLGSKKKRGDRAPPPPSSSPSSAAGSMRSTVSSLSYGSSQSGGGIPGVPIGGGPVSTPHTTDSSASFVSQDDLDDLTMVESYSGEWKGDKRSGFGVSERSDGLKYEGEWENNRKQGYGATTFRDGTREEGKYKANVLISSGKRSRLFLLRATKLKDRVDNAVLAAQRAAQIAIQKSDIAITRMASARTKADLAIQAANKAQSDADKARSKATEYAPDLFSPHPIAENDSSSKYSLGNHITAPATQPSITHQHQQQHHVGFSTQGPAAASIVSRVVREMTGGADAPTLVPSAAAVGSETARHRSAPAPTRQTDASSAAKAQPPPPTTQRATNATTKPSGAPSSSSSYSRSRRDDGGRPEEEEAEEEGAPWDRFSTLLTAAVIDDHFDQYITTPSGPPLPPRGGLSRDAAPHQHQHHQPDTASSGQHQDDGRLRTPPQRSNDLSSDSGVSSIGEPGGNSGGLSQRGGPLLPSNRRPALAAAGEGLPAADDTEPSSRVDGTTDRPGGVSWTPDRRKENGIWPASRVSTYATSTTTTTTTPCSSYGRGGSTSDGSPAPRQTPLHPPAVSMFRSTLRKCPNMGSMPEVSEGSGSGSRSGSGSGSGSAMPREEVHELSVRRREEIRRQREEEERRRRQEIVLRFTDIKDWCQRRQLLVLVIAVNISLATMFFNLLTQ